MILKSVSATQRRSVWPPLGFLLAFFAVLLPSQVAADEYASMARLLVGGSAVDPKLDNGGSIPDSFYVTQMEVIESALLRKRALLRLQGIQAKWKFLAKDTDVAIRTARTPNSRIINVLSTSKESEFAQSFLDSLLEEFLAWRQNLRDEEHLKKIKPLLDRLVAKQQEKEVLQQRLKAEGEVTRAEIERKIEENSKAYEELFKKAEALKLEFESSSDVISIMEHACPPIIR